MSEMKVKVPDQGQTKLVIGRGGARKGAGRKKTGLENRKVSISMLPDRWELLDKLRNHEDKTQSDMLASLIDAALELKLIELMDNDGIIQWVAKGGAGRELS